MNRTIDTATPEALMTTFAQRLNAGDLDGLIDLYDDAAVFEPSPGVVVQGPSQIRVALEQLLTLRPVLTSSVEQVLTAEDLALVVNAWSLVGTAPDGSEVTQSGRSADVLRRQSDGGWLVVIDKP
jgi:uncharacterized protein (TIGR02246 family)